MLLFKKYMRFNVESQFCFESVANDDEYNDDQNAKRGATKCTSKLESNLIVK